LTTFTNGGGRINAIVEDRRGAIWITRTRSVDDTGALCRVTDATQLRCYGKADGQPLRFAVPLAVDADGNFWLTGNGSVVRWRPDSSSTYAPPQLASATLGGLPALAVAADGVVWVGIDRGGPGLGLQQIQHGAWKSVTLPGLDASCLVVNALFLDRDQA